jgi:hypothetical protein
MLGWDGDILVTTKRCSLNDMLYCYVLSIERGTENVLLDSLDWGPAHKYIFEVAHGCNLRLYLHVG